MTFSFSDFQKYCLLLIALTWSQSVSAAWSVEPSYFLRAEHSDNIYLATPGNELAISGGTFSPAIKTIMEEDDQSLTADLDLQFTRYKEHEELDRDEGKAGMNWFRQTELSRYGVNASYANTSNLDSILETSGIGEKVDYTTANISPSWQYQMGERWSFSINLSYTDVEYDEPGLPGALDIKVVNFINNTDASLGLAVIRRMTEYDAIKMTYYLEKYEGISNGLQRSEYVVGTFGVYLRASERKLDYDYHVMQISYDHQFNESQSLNLQIGVSETDIRNQTRLYTFNPDESLFSIDNWIPTNTRQTGQVYNFSYKQKNEISRAELSASRNRVAAATGGLDETDTAKIFYSSNITERLSWAVDITRANFRPDPDTNVVSVTEYTRISASPSLYYMLDKDWSMALGYRYSEKDIESDDQARESSMIFFNMSWRKPNLLSTN